MSPSNVYTSDICTVKIRFKLLFLGCGVGLILIYSVYILYVTTVQCPESWDFLSSTCRSLKERLSILRKKIVRQVLTKISQNISKTYSTQNRQHTVADIWPFWLTSNRAKLWESTDSVNTDRRDKEKKVQNISPANLWGITPTCKHVQTCAHTRIWRRTEEGN